MPLFAPRGCIEPDAPDPTGLRLFAGHTDTTAALRGFGGQTGRLFADPAAGLRSGGIKPPRSPRNQHPARRIRYSAAWSPYSSAGPIIARRENEVSAVGTAALSRVQHVPNEAGEEDDDNADVRRNPKAVSSIMGCPPNWSRRYHVLRSARRRFTVYVHARHVRQPRLTGAGGALACWGGLGFLARQKQRRQLRVVDGAAVIQRR